MNKITIASHCGGETYCKTCPRRISHHQIIHESAAQGKVYLCALILPPLHSSATLLFVFLITTFKEHPLFSPSASLGRKARASLRDVNWIS